MRTKRYKRITVMVPVGDEEIVSRRTAMHVSQEEVARRLRRSRVWISLVETGDRLVVPKLRAEWAPANPESLAAMRLRDRALNLVSNEERRELKARRRIRVARVQPDVHRTSGCRTLRVLGPA